MHKANFWVFLIPQIHLASSPPAARLSGVSADSSDPKANSSKLSEIFWASLKLGLIAFGGPVAHLGYFRTEFVKKRQWLSDAEYADIVALCQFLPGPGSSQTIFALGMKRGGIAGGLLASLGFTAPSAILMILFAYGVTALGNLDGAGWLHGLKLAAVAVVAHAVVGMGRKLCPDLPRMILAAVAAIALILMASAWLQVGIILLGALFGWFLFRKQCEPSTPPNDPGSHRVAITVLGIFAALLVGLPIATRIIHNENLALFDSFYRSGSLVFGGGHVVLPLLQSEVVPNGWASNDAFLAGYSGAQAIPGPLFTFSAYLGTIAKSGTHAWLGGILCLVAIFTPALLLISGALPFWDRIRAKASAQAALRGANAAVVGILLAALYDPVATSSMHRTYDFLVVVIGFSLLQWTKCPPWAVVALAAGAGQWLMP